MFKDFNDIGGSHHPIEISVPISSVLAFHKGRSLCYSEHSLKDRNITVFSPPSRNRLFPFALNILDTRVRHTDLMIQCRYPNKIIVDLVRAWEEVDYAGNYEGISWGNININEKQNERIERDMAGTEF